MQITFYFLLYFMHPHYEVKAYSTPGMTSILVFEKACIDSVELGTSDACLPIQPIYIPKSEGN